MTCTLHAAHLYFVDFKANEKFNKEIFVYAHKKKNPKSWLIIKLSGDVHGSAFIAAPVQQMLKQCVRRPGQSSSFITTWLIDR